MVDPNSSSQLMRLRLGNVFTGRLEHLFFSDNPLGISVEHKSKICLYWTGVWRMTYWSKNWWWLHLFIPLPIWVYFTIKANINTDSAVHQNEFTLNWKGLQCIQLNAYTPTLEKYYTHMCIYILYIENISYVTFMLFNSFSFTFTVYSLFSFLNLYSYFISSNDQRD